jgi:hypothetical protein
MWGGATQVDDLDAALLQFARPVRDGNGHRLTQRINFFRPSDWHRFHLPFGRENPSGLELSSAVDDFIHDKQWIQ